MPLGSTKHRFKSGDLLFSKLRVYLKKVIVADEDGCCTSEILPLNFGDYCMSEYAQLFFLSPYFLKKVETLQYGCKMPRLGTDDGRSLLFPLPPKAEQARIVKTWKSLLSGIETIRSNQRLIERDAISLKRRILDSVFGENSSYKSYYEKELKLDEVLDYLQPGPYIVSNTKYSNDYKTPVLTPGKTFILGYTNDTDGIYKPTNKVIIFDDFTTASRLVDFAFKVKSSAMKILISRNEEKYHTEYLYLLLQTMNAISDSHKRFWISDFSQRIVKIHEPSDQLRIIELAKNAFSLIDKIVN